MAKIPHDTGFDNSLALVKDGYLFISKRCNKHQSDLFQTRLLLKRMICMRGEECAKLFYDTNLFKREGAAPQLTKKTLLGQGGVQGLDGDEHRNRKQMFMSQMTPEKIKSLVNGIENQWRAYISKWEDMDNIQLFSETNEILCRAACKWAGVPLPVSEVKERADDFMAIIDGSGSIGPRNWKGRYARKKLDTWLAHIIDQVRTDKLEVPEGSPLKDIASHRSLDGKLLDKEIAAVELNNIVRPTIALARFITFAALALHEHPDQHEKLLSGRSEDITMFVQEVRRYYPFFPMLTAITKRDFEWNGYQFAKGRQVLLDLYGTNHHTQSWQQPGEFRPERFRDWNGSPFNFIPQGGGDHHRGHRCAGEWITIEVMKLAIRMLTQEMDYEVPQQQLAINLSRLPTIPESRFIINNVRARTKTENRVNEEAESTH